MTIEIQSNKEKHFISCDEIFKKEDELVLLKKDFKVASFKNIDHWFAYTEEDEEQFELYI